jgi:hypothetical protein
MGSAACFFGEVFGAVFGETLIGFTSSADFVFSLSFLFASSNFFSNFSLLETSVFLDEDFFSDFGEVFGDDFFLKKTLLPHILWKIK